MKKIISAILAISITLALASCGESTLSTNDPGIEEPQSLLLIEIPDESNDHEEDAIVQEPFEGRIAIVTPAFGSTQYATYIAEHFIEKYGEDKIIHVTWPLLAGVEQDAMIKTVEELALDTDIRAIIVTHSFFATNNAFTKLRETRDDIFVVFCTPGFIVEEPNYSSQIADLILATDLTGMAPQIVQQAHKLGAETFVHYSFLRERHRDLQTEIISLMEQKSSKLGIKFLDIDSFNLWDESSFGESLHDDVSAVVEKYGNDTAFYSVDAIIHVDLLRAVLSARAIYPHTFHSHDFLTVARVLGVCVVVSRYEDGSLRPREEIIADIRAALSEKDMLNRVSSWPVMDDKLLSYASVLYAVKWINGEVPREGIDVDVLRQLMIDYAGVNVTLTPFTDEFPYAEEGTGETFDNFFMVLMDFITF